MDIPFFIKCEKGNHMQAIEEMLMMVNSEWICLRCYEKLHYQTDNIKENIINKIK